MDDEKLAREWLHNRRWERIGASERGLPSPTTVDEEKSLAALIARVRAEEREAGTADGQDATKNVDRLTASEVLKRREQGYTGFPEDLHDRYHSSPVFRSQVDTLCAWMLDRKITAGEMRDVFYVAAVKAQSMQPFPRFVVPLPPEDDNR